MHNVYTMKMQPCHQVAAYSLITKRIRNTIDLIYLFNLHNLKTGKIKYLIQFYAENEHATIVIKLINNNNKFNMIKAHLLN